MFKKLLCATVLTALAGATQAAEPGFYVGGGIGQSRYDDSLGNQIRNAYAGNSGFAFISGSATDDSDQAWKLFGGYRFLPWLGVEFGWVDLGEAQSHYVLHSQVPASNADALIDGLYNVNGPSATVFGELEFSDNFSGIARVGLFNAQLDYDEGGFNADGTPHHFSASNDSTETTFGLGLNVRVNPSWDVRLDWDRYLHVGNRFALTNDGNGRFDHIDMLSVNVAYRFNQQ